MVAWLVAVGVLPDQAGDVRLDPARGLNGGSEQAFQVRQIGRVATHQCLVRAHVMLHGKGVLPPVGFGVVKVYFSWVKSLNPSALSFGLNERSLEIEQVAPVRGPLRKTRLDFALAKARCEPCNACVVEGVFQRFGYAFVLVVRRNEPE